MSANLTHWTKEDLESLSKLDALLTKNVEWKVSTAELVQVYKSLVWMAGLKSKIDSSIAEIISIKQVNKPEESAE